VEKALEDETLIAWAMNGEDIPPMNGYPLRLVCAGWPGSVSGKWLRKIVVRNQVHDGPKMTGTSYRVPCKPVAPGTAVPDDDMCIIESMPVKSLITFPKSGVEHANGESLSLRGHAWAGDLDVTEVHVSTDFGANWNKATLEAPANRFAWQHWSASVELATSTTHATASPYRSSDAEKALGDLRIVAGVAGGVHERTCAGRTDQRASSGSRG
jgi:DMSO/TMAO reductase YedYZ molybdopterin-dependent catalytic subunit